MLIKLITLLIPFILVGCATEYVVKIDSISDGSNSIGKSFFVISGMKDVSTTDLRFSHMRQLLENALISKGFHLAQSPDTSELVVSMSYSISEPKESTTTTTVPVFNYKQGNTYNYESTSNAGNLGTAVKTHGKIKQNDTYETTYQSQTETNILYDRIIIISALSASNARKSPPVEKKIWETRVLSNGTSSDLRAVVPALIAASMDYFGKDSGTQVESTISTEDRRIKLIQQPNNKTK